MKAGFIIRKLRKENGFSQESFARHIILTVVITRELNGLKDRFLCPKFAKSQKG